MARPSRSTPKPPPDALASSASSAERSLRLLSLLAQEGRSLPLAELALRLGLPKATAHRLCTQLQAGGWLQRDIGDRSYVAGPALRRMAMDTLSRGVLRGLRHDALDALVREVGETCNFTALDGAQVLYLDRVEAQWPLRLTLDVGSHVPLHCTASGKLFLATMPPAQRRRLLAGLSLQRMTPRTLVEPAALEAESERILRDDHSCDQEEFITGLIAVAVPVRDAEGQVRAAVAVHAPTARMSLEQALSRLPALHTAAQRLSSLL